MKNPLNEIKNAVKLYKAVRHGQRIITHEDGTYSLIINR